MRKGDEDDGIAKVVSVAVETCARGLNLSTL